MDACSYWYFLKRDVYYFPDNSNNIRDTTWLTKMRDRCRVFKASTTHTVVAIGICLS